jgi:hypothetical protein
MTGSKVAFYLVIAALLCIAADAARLEPEGVPLGGKKVKKFHPYTSPSGLFIQVSSTPVGASHNHTVSCSTPSCAYG